MTSYPPILNRLLSSIQVVNYTDLVIKATDVKKDSFIFDFDSDVTTFIDAMTVRVQSPEPYVPVTISCNLLKTSLICNKWHNRMLKNTYLGDCYVTHDTKNLQTSRIIECAIKNIGTITDDGQDAGYKVSISGTLLINSELWEVLK